MEADEPALGQVPGDHYPAHRAAGAGDGWTKHTIITMLSRLEKKGAVAHRENGRAKEFWPVLDQAEPAAGRPGVFWTGSMAGAWG